METRLGGCWLARRVLIGRWFFGRACEDRCFSDRVTELASTRPLYIRDRDWVGGGVVVVVVVETMGVENPHPPSPLSRVTLFPRSRVSSTTDIIYFHESLESRLFFSQLPPPPSPLPLYPWDNTTAHVVRTSRKNRIRTNRCRGSTRPTRLEYATRKEETSC